MITRSNSKSRLNSATGSDGLSKYRQLKCIGKGTFGQVWTVQRISDGMVFVWKELYYGCMNEREKEQLVSEVNILRDLKHENIVRYHDRIIDRANKRIFIVMEYCKGGDLATVIKKHRSKGEYIDEKFIWRVVYQLSSALNMCHSKTSGKILHRDMKPGNVFLDGKGRVKLGDFGLARVLDSSTEMARTSVGTPYYMSPEVVNEKGYNEQSDIWSLGCLIYELAALHPPFQAHNQLALALKIQRGKYPSIPSRYSPKLVKLIHSLLQLDHRKRPDIQQLYASLNEAASSSRSRKLSKDHLEKETALAEKEKRLAKKEEALLEKEKQLIQLETRLLEKQKQLIEQEKSLLHHHDAPYHTQTPDPSSKKSEIEYITPPGKISTSFSFTDLAFQAQQP